jgi:hypothetical protein
LRQQEVDVKKAKTIIAAILILSALTCIGFSAVEAFVSPGEFDFLEDAVGAGAFHGTCMIIASFLLAPPVTTAAKDEQAKPAGKEG